MYQSFPQRHYNRSNTAMPVIREVKENVCENDSPPQKCECENVPECNSEKNNPLAGFFSSLELDDIILIGIILILLYEGSNDILMLALLGIILFF